MGLRSSCLAYDVLLLQCLLPLCLQQREVSHIHTSKYSTRLFLCQALLRFFVWWPCYVQQTAAAAASRATQTSAGLVLQQFKVGGRRGGGSKLCMTSVFRRVFMGNSVASLHFAARDLWSFLSGRRCLVVRNHRRGLGLSFFSLDSGSSRKKVLGLHSSRQEKVHGKVVTGVVRSRCVSACCENGVFGS